MFWAATIFLSLLIIWILPLPGIIALAIITFISTVSIFLVSNLLGVKVSFENSFKANTLGLLAFGLVFFAFGIGGFSSAFSPLLAMGVAFVAMLFICSQYLNTGMTQSFVIVSVAAIVNSVSLWLLNSILNLGLRIFGSA